MKNFLFFFLFLIISCSKTEYGKMSEPEQLVDKIAKNYGYGEWKKVKEIKFDFNVKRDSLSTIRNWVWNLENDSVYLNSSDMTIQFHRKNVLSEEEKHADSRFINDQFWAFTTHNIKNCTDCELSIEREVTTPIAKENRTKLTVVFPETGGYTPGDAYDLFVDDEGNVYEWIYRRANQDEPNMITTWQDHKTVNGIKYAENHFTQNGKSNIFITNVQVVK